MANKVKRKYSIGVFDSGFGGLQIMKHIVKELPEYNYIFLGDTARVPYGNRSQETILNFTTQAVDFLFKENCQLVICACNTASSIALRRIQERYLPENHPGRNVLGVVVPASEVAALITRNKRIGVIATERTVKSNIFEKKLIKINPKIKVFQKACPLLVPIIEAGEKDSEIAEIALKKYLKPLIDKKIDTLILGCTHYGILGKKIKKIVGSGISVIAEEKIIGKKLKNYLQRHIEIEKILGKSSKLEFFTTDLTEGFEIMGSKFFGKKIKPEKIILK